MSDNDFRGLEYLPFCQKMRDAHKGAEAIKANDDYLIIPQHYTDDEKEAYVKRAYYPEVVRRTQIGLIGRAFSKQFEIDEGGFTPEQVDRFDDRSDSRQRFFRRALGEVLLMNAVVYVVNVDGSDVSFAEYRRENVLHWELSRGRVSHLELHEMSTDEEGREVNNVRVLSLDENGNAFVRVDEITSGARRIEGDSENLTINGQPIDFIPAQVFGDLSSPHSLLEDLANLALDFYDENAQYRFAKSKLIPTLAITWGLTGEDLNEWTAGEEGQARMEIKLGSNYVINLPQGSTVGYVEYSGAGLEQFREEMDAIKQQMIAHGARALADQSGSNITEETARIQNSGEATLLSEIMLQFEADMNSLFRIAGLMARVNEPVVIFDRNFFDETVTATDLVALASSWLVGGLPAEVVANAARRGGWTELEASEFTDSLTTGSSGL